MQFFNEIEIDVFDLIKFVLNKWKIIIASALLFALLGGAYSVHKPVRSDETALSSDEKEEVENVICLEKQYEDGKIRVNEIMNNNSGSISEDEYYYIQSINQLYSITLNSKNAFTASQTQYYNAVLAGDDYEKPEPKKNPAKYIMAGAIGGAFIPCAVMGIIYCFSGKLRTEREISSYYGLFVIGRALKGKNSDAKAIAENIVFAARNANVSKLLVSKPISEKSKEIFSEVIKNIEDVDVVETDAVIEISKINSDEKDKYGAVFFEEIWCSKFSEISDNVNTCKEFDIPILGTVIIR